MEKKITIHDLALIIKEVVGFDEALNDASKPDGTPRKLMDSSRLKSTGWKPTMSLWKKEFQSPIWIILNLKRVAKFVLSN